ncbi:hypothetical protein FHS16_002432 [Paenibacillus endophyticus]|uniref:Uncharacterized protein n=1 Tax=Paenibacillus endophyticus TaxID=1294268 RepID=A0A7W5GAV7_9BACL|nr:class 1 isoprenoid biosynthesis enzyme [Paenibacillus endophyticus]MBB3152382.1 hypothetical protein [Paenibacillus endophyticus]
MEWFNRYKEQLGQVYSQAELSIAQFPEPLRTLGLAYADKHNPVKDHSGKDYICSLLPFWVKEPSGISDLECERLALANVYGMLYFFIQDDVMDSQPSSGWKEQLVLGNLFLLEMYNVFRQLFPSNSPFWGYYNRYAAVWAESVTNEDREDYFVSDPIRTAGKAGPVKIASTGALLLAGRTDLIEKLERAIEIVLMTLQMADDYADWKEDMAEGSYNGLLAMIAAGRSTGELPLTEKDAENAIYIRGCMQQYVQHASDNHKKLLELDAGMSGLIDFHSFILDHLNQIRDALESNKKALLKGGLNYFMTNSTHLQVQ